MRTSAALLQVKGQGELNFTWPELPQFPTNPNTGAETDDSSKPIDSTQSTSTMNSPPFGQPDGGVGIRNRNKNRNRGNEGDEDYDYDDGDEGFRGPGGGGGGYDETMIPPTAPEVKKNTDTSVVVKWQVPANDGLPISFFKIQYKDVSAKKRRDRQWQTYSADIDSNVNLQEVRRLKPGSTYKFRVLAVYSNNDNRPGPNSKRFTLEAEDEGRPNSPRSEPIIVRVTPSSPSTIEIQWQYYDENSINGFFIYYKVDHSSNKFKKVLVSGAKVRNYVLKDLNPDTFYKVKMVSYNLAGEGPPSNEVVKGTLPPKGSHEGFEKTRDPFEFFIPKDYTGKYQIPGSTKRPVNAYPEDRTSTAKSNQMLYIVLGVVVGFLILALLIFMLICYRKQKKDRRTMNACKNDSLRKKPQANGGPNFLLNDIHHSNSANGGLQDKVGNGYISTGFGGSQHHLSNGLNNHQTNPFHQLNNPAQMQTTRFESGTDRTYSPEDLEIQSLRANLQDMLSQPPPPIPPERGAPQIYPDPSRRHPHNYYEVDNNHQGTLPRSVHLDTFGPPGLGTGLCSVSTACPDCSQHSSRPHSRAESHYNNVPPPDYNSLNMRNIPHHPYYPQNHTGQPHRMSGGDYRDYTGSLHRNKPMTNPYHINTSKDLFRNSPDHIPRSHERPPFKSKHNSQNRNLRSNLPSYEHYGGQSSGTGMMNSLGSREASRGSLNHPSDVYERVPTDNHSIGSQGRPRKHTHMKPVPPHRSFSMEPNRPMDMPSENPLIIPPLPGGMSLPHSDTPPRLPPRNPPLPYNTPSPLLQSTAHHYLDQNSEVSPHHFMPLSPPPAVTALKTSMSHSSPLTSANVTNSLQNHNQSQHNNSQVTHMDPEELNTEECSNHSNNSSINSNHINKQDSPKVFIDDLSQELPVIGGGGGVTTAEETDTLPSSISNRADHDFTLSENMDSDLEAMQLSDHDDDLGINSSLQRELQQQVSDEELEPLVDNTSNLPVQPTIVNHKAAKQMSDISNGVEGNCKDYDSELNLNKNLTGNVGKNSNSDDTPLMQRNIPRANDYPSDDENEGNF